ncbi:hypothetical protein [Methylomicrobium sp. Wu6]|uniref:hypothetical protein n=1 Tax=Methylomicrobium sp. Wu6 TaxID=3107928 RepID=UPI002DD6AB4E|nr:hypothetical protein [Methylomicrobium sp. Wu6]MEC4748938.1 hypothetical protein [Methylomicrobium sp. Wu6]
MPDRIEGRQVGADFRQYHGGTDFIEARQSLQEMPIVGIRCHRFDQINIQTDEFRVQGMNMIGDVLQYEAMPGREFAVEGVFEEIVDIINLSLDSVGFN